MTKEQKSMYFCVFSILDRIINDLPVKRDWLDPQLEKEAKEILGYWKESSPKK